jgi:3D (Asp-Asp-Asp) domain-containing protein
MHGSNSIPAPAPPSALFGGNLGRALVAGLWLLALAALGCDDLGGWSSGGGEVVGASSDTDSLGGDLDLHGADLADRTASDDASLDSALDTPRPEVPGPEPDPDSSRPELDAIGPELDAVDTQGDTPEASEAGPEDVPVPEVPEEIEVEDDSYEPLVGFAGAFSLTYYYMVYEAAYIFDSEGQELPDYPTSPLLDTSCAPLATVATSFADAICVEGSGVIRDGRVVNLDNDCDCGHPCPNGRQVCFQVLDPVAFPHGMGAMGNALEPLRSVATDTDVLAYGTVFYLPAWDGLVIPDVDDLGAFVHDGCFRADDIGHGVDDYHVDIFAGSPGMWQALEWYLPTGSALPLYVDPGRCVEMRAAAGNAEGS